MISSRKTTPKPNPTLTRVEFAGRQSFTEQCYGGQFSGHHYGYYSGHLLKEKEDYL